MVGCSSEEKENNKNNKKKNKNIIARNFKGNPHPLLLPCYSGAADLACVGYDDHSSIHGDDGDGDDGDGERTRYKQYRGGSLQLN